MLLFGIAAYSDGLDGFLAKRFGWTSELGKVLDPMADKLLLMGVFLVGAWYGMVPRWLAAIAVGRDLVIGLGAINFAVFWGELHGHPRASSKVNTLMQLVYILCVLAHWYAGWPPLRLLDVLAAITAVTILYSGLGYVIEYARRALALNP